MYNVSAKEAQRHLHVLRLFPRQTGQPTPPQGSVVVAALQRGFSVMERAVACGSTTTVLRLPFQSHHCVYPPIVYIITTIVLCCVYSEPPLCIYSALFYKFNMKGSKGSKGLKRKMVTSTPAHDVPSDFEDDTSSPVCSEDDEGPPPPSGRASSPSVSLQLNDSAVAVFERMDSSPQENSSNSQDVGPAAALQNKRRKKNPSVILTDAQERALAQWLEVEGEFIYNRGKTAYKDKAKIARAWEEQGAKLEPPVSGTDLRTWFSSLRSRYGRLTNTVSGQAMGSKRHTDREKWILELFLFLKAHIVRQHKTATLGLPTENETPATRTTEATTSTRTSTNTEEGVSHGDQDTPSPASEDDEVVVVVPASKVPRKPRTRNNLPMKAGVAIDNVIDVAKHVLSDFKELTADRDTEGMMLFFKSLLPMVHNVGHSLIPMLKMELIACISKYEQATKHGVEVASQDLKYYIINPEYCPAPSPPKAQPQHQQQQLILEPQQLQQLQQLQQQLQQLVPQLPATFSSIRQQGQPAVTSITPQQLQLLQQQYILRGPSTSSIGGVPANNTSDLNMSMLLDMQLPGQASTAYTPAKTPPPQQSNTTLHTPTSSANV